MKHYTRWDMIISKQFDIALVTDQCFSAKHLTATWESDMLPGSKGTWLSAKVCTALKKQLGQLQ